MAKYEINHKCGHTSTVQLYGKTKDREWRISRMEADDCDDCIAAARREINEAEAAKNAAAGLPALQGSEKQILWAESIRSNLLPKIAEIKASILKTNEELKSLDETDPLPEKGVEIEWKGRKILSPGGNRHVSDAEKRAEIVFSNLENQSAASWWIDHRNGIATAEFIEMMKKIDIEPETVKEARKEAVAEMTLRPQSVKSETVCEIRIREKTVELDFPEKREDFRELVKFGHKFTWSGSRWTRTLGYYPDPAAKAAEMAAVILLAGFPVMIADNDVRAAVIAANIDPENFKRISRNTEKECFQIIWRKKDGDFYAAAKRITGAKYDSGSIFVPATSFAEVEDFAAIHGFYLSAGARELAAEQQKIRDAEIIVNPVIPETAKPEKPDMTVREFEVDSELQDDN